MDKIIEFKSLIYKPYFYFLLFLVLTGINPFLISGNNPYTTNLTRRLEPPSAEYLFGTDDLGRCVFSRVMHGARISIGAGLSILLLSLFFGGTLGILSGYFGGWVDEFVMRITDIFMTVPTIVIALVLARSLGPGIKNVIIILSITMWTGYARMIRGLVLDIKDRHYVETAKIIGLKNSYIILRHILPAILPPILVMASLGMGRNIIMTSSLSFLGLGIIEPAPDWGAMLNQGTAYIRTAPHMALFPGFFISLTVLSFNMLGDELGSAGNRSQFFMGAGNPGNQKSIR